MLDHKRKYHWFYHLFVYGLGFLLFWEWLRPVPVITETGSIHVFVLFTAFSFVITFLQLPSWVSLPLKFLAILYGVQLLFFVGPFLSLNWTMLFGMDIAQNVEIIFAGDWQGLSDSFRSFLLFVLLSIMSYLIYYWIVLKRRIFLFFLLTVLFVTTVDTFTPYDGTYAIIRVVIIGFSLLGLMQMFRLLENGQKRSLHERFSLKWLSSLILIILISSGFGFIMPKFDPQWSDPVPVVKKIVFGEDAVNGTSQTIGYSSYAEYLGGGFAEDDSLVFTAETKKAHYWRGEAMDFYTGKGWEVSTESTGNSDINLYRSSVDTERLEAKIQMAEGKEYPHIFYPGQFVFIGTEGRNFYPNTDLYTGKIHIYEDGQQVTLSQYTLIYDYPQFSLEALHNSNENDPSEIQDYYLQLPDDLPDRIYDLALEITEGLESRYEKAKAIEQYFFYSRFQYETVNVPRPNDNEDYVDQFLFETQRGYCDNFSSAMAVLLRTLDIPTRWVRGFTPGQLTETSADDVRVYEVRNENAHSWVEVYFPDVGWVPFEPTVGYNNTAEFINDTEEEQTVENEEEVIEEEEEEVENIEEETKEEEQEDEVNVELTDKDNTIRGSAWLKIIPLVVLGLVLIHSLIKCIIFFVENRRRFYGLLQYYRFQKRDDDQVFEEAYNGLLKILDKHGIKRGTDETLREYACKVDRLMQSTEMGELTKGYEKVCYGGKPSSDMWNEMKPLWESLVKKMSS
ncbi:DUF4129 domain-containing transglutaminase family protein [Anaerobacillus sp. MEB173]|uniref:DUF4129 domain-containing transglutaminase family protein n=1 Tax=Anaerobacillus sp. MEB173 TaxID=3383345 RepID=UPI003F8E6F1B